MDRKTAKWVVNLRGADGRAFARIVPPGAEAVAQYYNGDSHVIRVAWNGRIARAASAPDLLVSNNTGGALIAKFFIVPGIVLFFGWLWAVKQLWTPRVPAIA